MSDKKDGREGSRDSEKELMKGLAALFLRDAEPITPEVEVEYSDDYSEED